MSFDSFVISIISNLCYPCSYCFFLKKKKRLILYIMYTRTCKCTYIDDAEFCGRSFWNEESFNRLETVKWGAGRQAVGFEVDPRTLKWAEGSLAVGPPGSGPPFSQTRINLAVAELFSRLFTLVNIIPSLQTCASDWVHRWLRRKPAWVSCQSKRLVIPVFHEVLKTLISFWVWNNSGCSYSCRKKRTPIISVPNRIQIHLFQ